MVSQPAYRIGEAHPNARLSNDQVDEIRTLREDEGWSYSQLAERFTMSKSAIAAICRYETWLPYPIRRKPKGTPCNK